MNSHNVFKFKQFAVSNCRSAMRVGTDGVLLGAWHDLTDASVVWDVGCGTGLIALMAAQRNAEARIVAFEIDADAAAEAHENFEASPWKDRLAVVEGDFCETHIDAPAPDLIVSNPPYFDGGLVSPDGGRDTARRQNVLTYRRLLEIAAQRLSADGRVSLIAPADLSDGIEFDALLLGLKLSRRCGVSTLEGKPAKRVMLEFARNASSTEDSRLSIYSLPGEYSDRYRELTKDFYLNF